MNRAFMMSFFACMVVSTNNSEDDSKYVVRVIAMHVVGTPREY
jgi:hypothetical protein